MPQVRAPLVMTSGYSPMRSGVEPGPGSGSSK